ncbi:Uncharacterized protein OBRU01_22276, partial [Operophtera brumata]
MANSVTEESDTGVPVKIARIVKLVLL